VTEAAPDLADAVGRAQQGDAEAFRLLYRDIQPRLLHYLHALAGQDADDLAAWPAPGDTAQTALEPSPPATPSP
jgi:hypothetical protein